MDMTTMTMNAASCVLSVRPRLAGPFLLADTRVLGEGITVSIAMATRVAADRSFTGVVSGAAFAYKTLDVARSLSGRPPV